MSQVRPSHSDLRNPTLLPDLPPEIRFEPSGCRPEDIHRANTLEGRMGDGVFESVEKAIARIRTEEFPSEARLESWARHPDERVAIAFLSNGLDHLSSEDISYVLSHLILRAIQEAQARGEVWTPLLDTLLSSTWSEFFSLASSKDQMRVRLYLKMVVSPWASKQKDANVLRNVIRRTQSPDLIWCIAFSAECIDRPLLDTMLETCPTAACHLAKNDHLPPELYEHLLHRIVTDTIQIQDDLLGDGYDLEVAYSHLAERGVYLQQNHIEHLSNLFPADNSQSNNWVHVRALRLLNQHVCVTGDEEVALRMIEMAGRIHAPSWPVFLIRESKARSRLQLTPRLGHAALAHCGQSTKVIKALAEQSIFRQDPDIRRQLFESSHPTALFELGKDGRPDEFPLLFKRLASTAPHLALELIEYNRELATHTLSHADLLPLLQAPSQDIRLGALALMGELQNTSKGVYPTTQRRSF